MKRREFLKVALVTAASLVVGGCLESRGLSGKELPRPNIVWIEVEDTSCHFGYQGEKLVKTPNIDKLAKEGAVFTHAYISSPVCSPGRSALVTGMYQTSTGSHNHRSYRATKRHLEPQHKLIPQYFREVGYYVVNDDETLRKKSDKTDYNFTYNFNKVYDDADITKRKQGQPFFAQVQLRGGKLRGYGNWKETFKKSVDNPVTADQVTLPPYYPDHPLLRDDWAEYLNTIQYTDLEVGHLIETLRNDGVLDNTVIIFMTDHGISHARGKQFMYEEGIKIPFVVWAPKYIKPQVRKDFASQIDMGATSMYFAGIEIPSYMESRPLFGPGYKKRDYVVSARDRCDETVDRIRSVRKGNFKYIRNFYPERPYLQPCVYKDTKPILRKLRELRDAGTLNDVQMLHFAETRAPEELYDLSIDKWEVNNIAGDVGYKNTLVDMRGILNKWIEETGDKGQYPESAAEYDAEMQLYLDGIKDWHWRKDRKEYAKTLKANIALMKKWQSEGK
jgi:arylsulfatase A-like enzyme